MIAVSKAFGAFPPSQDARMVDHLGGTSGFDYDRQGGHGLACEIGTGGGEE